MLDFVKKYSTQNFGIWCSKWLSTLHKFQHKPISIFLTEQLLDMELWHKRMATLGFNALNVICTTCFSSSFFINASKLIRWFF
jgi:aconitase A